jgi:hypothetical protein
MKAFFSIILALALSMSAALAKHGGGHGGHGGQRGHGGFHGKHGKHFSSVSRGGHKFSRGGPKFSRGKSEKYRAWSGRNWGGRNWSGGNWGGGWWNSGNRFIYIGGFGYPYYWGWYPSWGWRAPYAFNYGYYSYGYYPSSWYDYDPYCSVSRKRFFAP